MESEKKPQSTLRDTRFLDLIGFSSSSESLHENPATDAVEEEPESSSHSLVLYTDHLDEYPVSHASGIAELAFAALGALFVPLHPLNQGPQLAFLQNPVRFIGRMLTTEWSGSRFYPIYNKKQIALQPGKSTIDTKVIEAGFNVRVLFRSRRLLPDQPRLIRYTLLGNQHQFSDFITNQTQRHKDVYSKFAPLIHRPNWSRSTSQGFERLAQDFFDGKEVHGADHYEAESPHGSLSEESLQLDHELQPKPSYQISSFEGDWSEVLDIVERDNLLDNGPFITLLRDLVMNNDLEDAARRHSTYHGFKVQFKTKAVRGAEKNLDLMRRWESGETPFDMTCLDDSTKQTAEDPSFSPSRGVDPASNDVTWLEDEPVMEKTTPVKKKPAKKGKCGREYSKKHNAKQSKSRRQEGATDLDSEAADVLKQGISKESVPDLGTLQLGISATKSATGLATKADTGKFDHPESDDGGSWSLVQPKSTRKLHGSWGGLPPDSDGTQDWVTSPMHHFQTLYTGSSQLNACRPQRGAAMTPSNDISTRTKSVTGGSGAKSVVPIRFDISPKTLGPTQKAALDQGKDERVYDPADYPAMVSPPSRVYETALGGDSKAPRIPLNPPAAPEDSLLMTSNASKISLSCDGLDLDQETPEEPFANTENPSDADLLAIAHALGEHRQRPGLSKNMDFEQPLGTEATHEFVTERSMTGDVREADKSSNGSVSGIDNAVHYFESSCEYQSNVQPRHDIGADEAQGQARPTNNGPGNFPAHTQHCQQEPAGSPLREHGGASDKNYEYESPYNVSRSSLLHLPPLDPNHSHIYNEAHQVSQYKVDLPAHMQLNGPSTFHGHPIASLGLGSELNFSSGVLPHLQPPMNDTTTLLDIDGPCLSYVYRDGHPSLTGKCTFCHDPHSIDAFQTMCPACGPKCNIRYCSTACLLVDALQHSAHCMQRPVPEGEVLQGIRAHHLYQKTPIFRLDGSRDPPHRFRQKTFSMYCYSGRFPKLYKTWTKRFDKLSMIPGFDENESIKKTGDYAVFRSEFTGGAPRYNPDADVIYTIKLDPHNPKKGALNRALNACFLLRHAKILEFLARLISDLILVEEHFEKFKYTEPPLVVFEEFCVQFRNEFGFDAATLSSNIGSFEFDSEWPDIDYTLRGLETAHPELLQWLR